MPGNKLDLDKLRSIGQVRAGRLPRNRVKEEGRAHPDSGLPYKTVQDENGNDTTEHGAPGTAVSSRQDAHIFQREPVTAEIEVPRHE